MRNPPGKEPFGYGLAEARHPLPFSTMIGTASSTGPPNA